MSAGEKATLELPLSETAIAPSLCFLEKYASDAGLEVERVGALKEACSMALGLVLKNNRRWRKDTRVGLEVFKNDGQLVVEVFNRGVPLFLTEANGNGSGSLHRFHEATRQLDKVTIENHGRKGQTLVLGARLGKAALHHTLSPDVTQTPDELTSGEIIYRELQPGEETALSQLFYFVYGYNYINDFVYYPEKIKALIEQNELISIVATLRSGQLVGHVGIRKWKDSPAVYEPCLGVVHPAMKSRGVFGHIFEKTMERVKQTPMQYCFFDFVTNHDFTQRFVSRYKPADMAIFVGCQSKATQASLAELGLGQDPPEMDRYSLLFSIIPCVNHPFGAEIQLPTNLGEWLGFLLKPLNLRWVPAPRFQLLPDAGEYKVQVFPSQNAALFDLYKPGRDAVDRLLKEWHLLLRGGYQYASVEVPVSASGLGNLYDLLADEGFFVSGFVPYQLSGQLGIRFQTIGPTRVAWDDIRIYSPQGKQLLDIIRSDYERNGLL